MLDWFWKEYSMFNLHQQYKFMDMISRTSVWPADEYYDKNIDVKLFDVQICIDYTFLRSLPLCLDDALSNEDICGICYSYGMSVRSFYKDGFLDFDIINQFYECNMRHFVDYRNRAYDNLKLSNKSKVANSAVLDNSF